MKRINRFLQYPVMVLTCIIPLVICVKIFYVDEVNRWRNDNADTPWKTVSFSSVSKEHMVFLNHMNEDEYAAFIPTECNAQPVLGLKYSDHMVIDGNRYYDGDVLTFPSGVVMPFAIYYGSYEDQPDFEGNIVFYYADNVPSFYIDTETGTMDSIDQKGREYSEQGRYTVIDINEKYNYSGICEIKARGNTTWKRVAGTDGKKPYNITLDNSVSLLGMGAQKKWTLLANFFDGSELRTYVALKMSEKLDMPVTCDSRFVNLYLNGEYAGLYQLTQHLDVTGGNVDIRDLGAENRALIEKENYPPENITEGEDENYISYYDASTPNTYDGGYLMEFSSHAITEGGFMTDHQYFLIESPRYPTYEEIMYISDYVRTVEAYIYEYDDETYSGYLDSDSWAKMYLLRDFFVAWDEEFNSSYMYKDSLDNTLYAGPAWDFDISMGQIGYHSMITTNLNLLKSKGDISWLYELYSHHIAFSDLVNDMYYSLMVPYLNEMLDVELPYMYEYIKQSAYMDYARYPLDIRSGYTGDFDEEYDFLIQWLNKRQAYYSSYLVDPENYVEYIFDGDLKYSYCFKVGDVIQDIPLDDAAVVNWTCTDDGSRLVIGDIVDHDRYYSVSYE